MGKAFIKGGTPVGSASRCRTCTAAHIMTGYRESEQITLCEAVQPNIVIPFPIYECTSYYDKNRPSWKEMKELALDVSTSPFKPVPGFNIAAAHRAPAVTLRRPADEDDD